MNITADVTSKRALRITCSSCGQEWTDGHRCPVAPQIDWSHYTTEALQRVADHLALVLEGRRKAAPPV